MSAQADITILATTVRGQVALEMTTEQATELLDGLTWLLGDDE